MQDNAGTFYVYNGQVNSTESPEFGDMINSSVYEVIRVIRGVPLFFEDHITRMTASLRALDINKPIPFENMKSDIKKLLEAEAIDTCNVKIMVKIENGMPAPLLYISQSYYPPDEVVEEGVRTGLLQLERNNPNAKILNLTYKETVAEKIKQGNFFEVLLVNKDNVITEGSRSNVFIVQGNEIYTTPGSLVLLGITRKYVFQACENAGYKVKEDYVDVTRLQNVDALFLSGTSIKVLPIFSLDEREFKSSQNQVVDSVRKEYDAIIENYINNANW